LTLYDDINHLIGEGFDAVICVGNSFAHMMDNFGDQREQKQAIRNFERCIKPGGVLLIDHRNYDHIMDSGATPSKSIYYNVSPKF
jgi:glycine N-methyltransferase